MAIENMNITNPAMTDRIARFIRENPDFSNLLPLNARLGNRKVDIQLTWTAFHRLTVVVRNFKGIGWKPGRGFRLPDFESFLFNKINENVELYGCKSDGTVVPTIAKKIWETKQVKEYVIVELNNGEIIECTPEHGFMLSDGTYQEARYLLDFMLLMSITGNLYITKIKIVNISDPVSVYDIEVPETNNFALSAGIFVHNSKDLADAVGQLVYFAHINPVYSDLSLLPITGNSDIVEGNIESKEEIQSNFDEWARGK